jgi:AraC-like DNA-binding protein
MAFTDNGRSDLRYAKDHSAVVCLLPRPAESYSALRATRARTRFAHCMRNADLIDTCARVSPVGVVVAALEDVDGIPTASTIRVAHVVHPDAIIVIFCSRSRSSSRLLLDVVRDGAHVLVQEGIDSLDEAIREALSMCAPTPPVSLLPLVAASLAETDECVDAFARYSIADTRATRVAGIARALQISKRTLSSQFRRAGLPSPAVFLMRLRLIRAMYILCYERRPLIASVEAAGFSSSSALRAALRRHYAVSPSKARNPAVLSAALAGLSERMDRTIA